ncbi:MULTISPECIES: helix-turn-helix domain-containing protein [Brenneria]|uniref:Helix-turn-helix domain-containing protein n=3 Tax=Brenneria TaxID=71655 RepID=A0A2U1UTL3_9GAMM|nr:MULTISPECIES: helix-turn-helix domain-containing protein [Brenneria]EHD19785.1 transcriptional regulator, XRE family [Brenneria sp. EniD312]MCL2892357.1 type II toxin-antitoxin system MqsA family antitoxin [Brenneria tiliae]MCL2897786.1 type II toxin-antitoxin system MqsA family antitoxin [Brenneria tiliae]MCL2902383.1 type II toxin-antitoxin system MqsA family antitoxin [Brenneria tiliae]PWC14715.1 transcriptional regulator [Brenneria sp. CFCC 11842]
MSNRNLFDELVDGMKAWGEMNAGKKTLKSHRVAIRKRVSMTPDELKSVREKLNLSQAVFAQYLHTAETTYQNWEQGRAKPNPQAVLLIKMVEQNPDTLRTLAAL